MKIAMIAMSGIRCCDEELLRLGLTLPGFLERSQTIASLPSLGLLTLAGMTHRRHEVEYHEVDQIDELQLAGDRYDLVLLSSFTAQVPEAYALADRLRAAGCGPVVMGGLHATALPDEVLEHCDAVAVGEGEVVWPRILYDVEHGTLERIYKADQEFDLADAPMPRFDLLDVERYNRLTVQTTRGCPLKCSFCASSILLTSKYKHKPVEKVLAEIDAIRDIWPRPFIEFADDNSFANAHYWKQLLPELAKRKVKWFTETDIRIAGDAELLTMMREAGCAEVLVGLESPVPEGLKGLEILGDWKHRRLEHYESSVKAIQSHGIRVNGCFILGLDGHTTDIFDRTYDFAKQLELYDVQVTLQTPFPGTPLYKRLKSHGRLLPGFSWDKCTLFDVTYQPDPMSVDELRQGFRDLVVRLYDDETTQWRRDVFKRKYRRGSIAA